MSRYRLHRVQALWPIAAAGLLLVVLPAVAWADDCGSLADCFHGAVATVTTATTAIAFVVYVRWNDWWDAHHPATTMGHWDDHGDWIPPDDPYPLMTGGGDQGQGI